MVMVRPGAMLLNGAFTKLLLRLGDGSEIAVHLTEAHAGALPSVRVQVAVGWHDNDARCLDAP